MSTDLLRPFRPDRPPAWNEGLESIARAAPNPTWLYLVGGAVRDALLGYPAHDIDLATPDDGLMVARRIANALGGAYYPVDHERRTGRALVETAAGPLVIDVSSFRGASLLEDLRGRDFTVNALAARLDNPDHLIDPLGGYADLFTHKLLRQCSPTSIADDPIRALRAVRHAMQFGLRIEPDTRAAARAAAPLLASEDGRLHQPERARDELFKLLEKTRPAAALRLLSALGLLDVLLPPPLPRGPLLEHRIAVVEWLDRLLTIIGPGRDDNSAAGLILGVAVMTLDRCRAQLQEHLSCRFGDGRGLPGLLVLGALTPPDTALAGDLWGEHLRLSNMEARLLDNMLAARAANPLEPARIDARFMHRYYRATGEAGIDGLLLALAGHLADQGAHIDPTTWGEILEGAARPLLEAFFRHHQQIVTPPPLLTGDELMAALGIAPGPEVGRLLTLVLEAQAAGEIATKDEALRLAGRLRHDQQGQPPTV